MEQHHQSFEMREMAMPLMETPEQQEIIELKEQLEQEKESHKETKLQLEDAQIKLTDRASEVEGLRNTIQCLVIRDKKSAKEDLEAKTEPIFQVMKMELEKINKKFDDYKLENDKKADDHKVGIDKKFDDLKEQISKGQNQEELQKLKELNEKLESENALLQKELSDSNTETKWWKECFEEFKEINVRKDNNFQELVGIIRQKDYKSVDLVKELSGVQAKFEKRDLDYEEMKKKYEEAVMELNCMNKLHQQQKQQLQQQLDKMAGSNQIPTEDSFYSKELTNSLLYCSE